MLLGVIENRRGTRTEEGQVNILAPLLEGVRHWPPWLLTSSSTRSGAVCTLTPRIFVAFLKLPPAEVIGGRRRRLDVCSFVVVVNQYPSPILVLLSYATCPSSSLSGLQRPLTKVWPDWQAREPLWMYSLPHLLKTQTPALFGAAPKKRASFDR